MSAARVVTFVSASEAMLKGVGSTRSFLPPVKIEK